MLQDALRTGRERGIAIYVGPDGKPTFTEVFQGTKDRVDWSTPGKPLAFVHMHPDIDGIPTISEADRAQSRQTGVPYYVANANGEILVYDPKRDEIRALPTD